MYALRISQGFVILRNSILQWAVVIPDLVESQEPLNAQL